MVVNKWPTLDFTIIYVIKKKQNVYIKKNI